jgi:tetratricopeptide (TPR) repeat protein
VGRRQERSRVETVIDGALGGGVRLLLLTGEPGVGKTRLAQEASIEARRRGFLVATGRCYEPEQGVPFYPMLEALAMTYLAAPRSIQEEMPRRWPYLSRLLPDQSYGHPMSSSGGEEEQQWLFRAVTSFVQAIAVEVPVAVLLDDLHWSDSSSLKLLLHLVRHTRGHRVLLMGTYRDIDVHQGHPLQRALIDLNREQLVERLVVRPLPPPATTELIAAIVGGTEISPAVADLVHLNTDGNPLFVQEVIRAMLERGDLYQDNGCWTARNLEEIRVPEGVRSTISERLLRLSPQTQAVLYEASVVGQSFAFEALQRISQRREEEVERALEEAAAVGLVSEVGEDKYAFNHALTQQAFYDDLPARRRRRLHLAVAEALDSLPDSLRNQRAGDIARHFIESGDTERALPHALQAGDQAQQVFAYSEAERYYRMALELGSATWSSPVGAERIGESPLPIEGLAKLGGVLNILQEYDEALAVLERASELYRQRGDLDRQAGVIAQIGWIHRLRGTEEEGIARISTLIDSLERKPASHFALACLGIALTRLYFSLGRYEEELAAAERASSDARAADNDFLRAITEARRGAALITIGRRDDARAVLQEAVALVETTADRASTGADFLASWAKRTEVPFLTSTGAGLLESLAQIYRDSGDFERSRQYFEQALEVAEQAGIPGRTGWALVKLGGLAFLFGDWLGADAYFERASRIFGTTHAARYSRLQIAQLGLAKGELEEATQSLQEIIADSDPRRDLWLLRQAQRLLAERDLVESRPRAALRRLEPLLDRPGLQEPQVTALLPLLAWAHLRLGDRVATEEVLGRCLQRARAQSYRLAEADALRTRGMLRTMQKRWEEARGDFEQAISLSGSMPFPYGEARARYEYGTMCSEAGEPTQARDQWEAALAILQRLGARYDIELVMRALPEARAVQPHP